MSNSQDRALLDRIAKLIRDATRLNLFGADVIKCAQSELDGGSSRTKWAVIDVNVCPSKLHRCCRIYAVDTFAVIY